MVEWDVKVAFLSSWSKKSVITSLQRKGLKKYKIANNTKQVVPCNIQRYRLHMKHPECSVENVGDIACSPLNFTAKSIVSVVVIIFCILIKQQLNRNILLLFYSEIKNKYF